MPVWQLTGAGQCGFPFANSRKCDWKDSRSKGVHRIGHFVEEIIAHSHYPNVLDARWKMIIETYLPASSDPLLKNHAERIV